MQSPNDTNPLSSAAAVPEVDGVVFVIEDSVKLTTSLWRALRDDSLPSLVNHCFKRPSVPVRLVYVILSSPFHLITIQIQLFALTASSGTPNGPYNDVAAVFQGMNILATKHRNNNGITLARMHNALNVRSNLQIKVRFNYNPLLDSQRSPTERVPGPTPSCSCLVAS